MIRFLILAGYGILLLCLAFMILVFCLEIASTFEMKERNRNRYPNAYKSYRNEGTSFNMELYRTMNKRRR